MAEALQLDVLAIAAHPDDIEITSGGLLIKMGKLGRKTGALDLTRGEMGSFGTPEERDAEAANAAAAMGLTYRSNLGFRDSAIEESQANKLKVAEVIRTVRPEMVILPHWNQRHPDHLACSRISYDACFLAGLKKIDIPGEPFRPRKIIYAAYSRTPEFSFLVDITDEFEQKCQAVAAYKSQFDDPERANRIFHPGVNIFDSMRIRGQQLGLLAGVKYAEAYTIKESMLIDDPQKMPVASI